jgi:hypothetical protein
MDLLEPADIASNQDGDFLTEYGYLFVDITRHANAFLDAFIDWMSAAPGAGGCPDRNSPSRRQVRPSGGSWGRTRAGCHMIDAHCHDLDQTHFCCLVQVPEIGV